MPAAVVDMWVWLSLRYVLESPKSAILTCRLWPKRMLLVFTSRWTIDKLQPLCSSPGLYIYRKCQKWSYNMEDIYLEESRFLHVFLLQHTLSSFKHYLYTCSPIQGFSSTTFTFDVLIEKNGLIIHISVSKKMVCLFF